MILNGIVNHRNNELAIKRADGFIDINGVRRRKITTASWPRGDSHNEAAVKKRKRTVDRNYLVGKENSNPILDTRIYEVEFPDGGIGEYTTNIIAESLYLSCDDEGR